MLLFCWRGDSQEREREKTRLQGKLPFSRLFYFVLPVTTSTNKMVIKETTFWTLSDWTMAINVIIVSVLAQKCLLVLCYHQFGGRFTETVDM